MKVTVNRTVMELPESCTVGQALETAKISPIGIAVAVNDTVVPKAEYATRCLNEGDNVIIIKAFYGG